MSTLDPSSWNVLAQKQLERALAGDSAAARWCAEHRPGNDGTPETLTDLLTPTERARFEWCISRNKQSPREALVDCMAASYFAVFTTEELQVWLDHLDARQATDAALPQNYADRMARALRLALERDQDPEEIKANEFNRKQDERVWTKHNGLDGAKTDG